MIFISPYRCKEHIGFLILLLTIVSCSNIEREEADEPAFQINQFQSYKIEMDMPQVALADVIDTIEVMRLEETAESIIGHVSRLEESSSGYVLSHQKLGFLFFNFDGDFVSRFYKKGLGPDEYADIHDYWLEGDTIAVFSRESQRINRYDFSGSFISSVKLTDYTQHVRPMGKSFVHDINFGGVKDSIGYRVLIVDDKHRFEKAFLPFSFRPAMKVFSQFPSIKPYGRGVVYLGLMSDTVYHIDPGNIKPIVHFDFGDKWYWTKKSKMNPKQHLGYKGQKVDIIDADIGNRHVWLGASYILNERQSFLIDRVKGVIFSIDLRNKGDGRHSLFPIKWTSNRLLFSIQSNDLEFLLGELEESKVRFRKGTTLQEIESSENPVLVWMKFK